MAAERFKLTNETVRSKCLPPAADERTKSGRLITQKIYWDAELPGFGVVVGHTAKTFVAQADVRGRTIRPKIGRFPKITADQARKDAKQLLGDMAKGINPVEERRKVEQATAKAEWETITLSVALEHYVARLQKKGRSPRSIETVRYDVKRYLGDWLEQPLVTITPKMCYARHVEVTEKRNGKGGPRAANKAFKALRTIWNRVRRMYPEQFPAHPVSAVEFNAEVACKTIIPAEQLPAWWAKVRALENPVRRNLQLVMLFTGLRAMDASTIRWSEIDFKAATIHRPAPKGGTAKAFTVPLCRFVVRLLTRHRRYVASQFGASCQWVFPTHNRAGKLTHVQEQKELEFNRDAEGNVVSKAYLPSPHTLRRTFRSVGHACGVDDTTIGILMNHVVPSGKSNITNGYLMPDAGYGDPLRAGVEKIAAVFLAKKRAERKRKAKGVAAMRIVA